MVKAVVTGLRSNHYFTQSDKVRDTSIEGLLMKMHECDFIESQLQHSKILSTLSSSYNPLGLASPFILTSRKILQDLCQKGRSKEHTLGTYIAH